MKFCLRSEFRAFIASFTLLCGIASIGRAQAQKLPVAYTAFASTFTILWVGNDSGLYQKYGADMQQLYIGSSTKSVQALPGRYTRTTDSETLDASYKENVKDYALRIPYVSVTGLTSILEFRAETAAEARKLALEKMFDNSLLQEIQKETAQ